MKTLGIIGGVAWPSSVVYYQKINELVAQRLGGLHCAKLVLTQPDFELVAYDQREKCWAQVGAELSDLGNALKSAGADFFLIACNTVHIAAEQIEPCVEGCRRTLSSSGQLRASRCLPLMSNGRGLGNSESHGTALLHS